MCKGRTVLTEGGEKREREGAAGWMSGTGGQGQSLSHLGSSSPSALDRLTRIRPPAQEGPRAHTHTHRVGVSLPHTCVHMDTCTFTKNSSKQRGRKLLEATGTPWGEHSNYANACQFINLVLDTTHSLDYAYSSRLKSYQMATSVWMNLHIMKGKSIAVANKAADEVKCIRCTQSVFM